MRRTLLLAFCAGFGALTVAGSKTALATPAIPTVRSGETSAGLITVGYRHRYRRRGYYGGYGGYYGGYAYRPYPYYYRPYPYYYRPYYPYYRPYAYYPYPYY